MNKGNRLSFIRIDASHATSSIYVKHWKKYGRVKYVAHFFALRPPNRVQA